MTAFDEKLGSNKRYEIILSSPASLVTARQSNWNPPSSGSMCEVGTELRLRANIISARQQPWLSSATWNVPSISLPRLHDKGNLPCADAIRRQSALYPCAVGSGRHRFDGSRSPSRSRRRQEVRRRAVGGQHSAPRWGSTASGDGPAGPERRDRPAQGPRTAARSRLPPRRPPRPSPGPGGREGTEASRTLPRAWRVGRLLNFCIVSVLPAAVERRSGG